MPFHRIRAGLDILHELLIWCLTALHTSFKVELVTAVVDQAAFTSAYLTSWSAGISQLLSVM